MTDIQIVWFKRDLRVEDHRVLAAAAARGPVLPLYVAEPDWWAGADASARQWGFIQDSLTGLQADLAACGQALVVRTGEITKVLEYFYKTYSVTALWSHEETGNNWSFQRDKRVAAWCRDRGIVWTQMQQAGVIRRIASRDSWAQKWDSLMAEPVALPPSLAPLSVDLGEIPDADRLGLAPDPCPDRQAGGRRAGEELLQSFLYQRGERYQRQMSSPVAGANACSRLSPHLAWGTLSSREVALATWARQRQLKADGTKGMWRKSMTSYNGRLHWRCHFMQKLEDAPSIEFRNLHPAYDGMREGSDQARLEAWATGETGLPFVDATMRCLQATGWMNFRMRAMLMAVASYHLWLDWRQSGAILARRFTDYEPGIHWPQVQMQSGTTGINTVRVYNPVKQGHDQDPEGDFVRHWVPELAEIPGASVHEPWKTEIGRALLGKRYPQPIVDHMDAARDAREAIWAVRKGVDYRANAQSIVKTHASRRRPDRAPRRPKAKETRQLDLPFD